MVHVPMKQIFNINLPLECTASDDYKQYNSGNLKTNPRNRVNEEATKFEERKEKKRILSMHNE